MKKHKFLKFNLVDTFVVVLILFLLFFYERYMFGNVFSNISDSEENIDLKIKIESQAISEVLSENINIGDTVINLDSGAIIGVVDSITLYDCTFTSEEGFLYTLPEYKSAHITVMCSAEYNGDSYFINGEKIVIGEMYNFSVPNLAFSGKCTSLE